MSTLFGHTWDDETCYLHTLLPESDPPFQSPAQILSPDILLQIFEWAQSADAGPDHPGFLESDYYLPPSGHTIFSRAAVPWNVSQVCRSWRVVALESAKLWSTIVVYDGSPAFWKAPKMRNNLKWFLKRSRRVPLTISARMNMYDSDRSNDTFPLRVFIQRLVNERSRWKRVSIVSRDISFPSSAPNSMNSIDNLVELEELALVFPTGYKEGSAIHLDFSGCRKLQKLYLLGDFKVTYGDTSMEQLRHVELGRDSEFLFRGHYRDQYPSLANCEALLRLSSSLKSLTIEIRCEEMSTDDTIIHLPCLEDFRFGICAEGSEVIRGTHLLINKLVMPSLKNLHVREGIEPTFEGLFQRSNCSVLSVFIDVEADDERAVLSEGWMPYLRCLKFLKLGCVDIRSGVLAKLVLSGRGRDQRFQAAEFPELKGLRDRDLCPNLESIEFERCHFEGDSERMAKLANAMIRSRLKTIDGSRGALKTLRMNSCKFLPPGLDANDELPEERPNYSEMLQLVRDGVDNECINTTTYVNRLLPLRMERRRSTFSSRSSIYSISLEIRNQDE